MNFREYLKKTYSYTDYDMQEACEKDILNMNYEGLTRFYSVEYKEYLKSN